MSTAPKIARRRSPLKRSKMLAPLAAGLLVMFGTLILMSSIGDTAATELQPTLVVTESFDVGTAVDEVLKSTEVRLLPVDARAEGAFGSVAEATGTGANAVLASSLVDGQQLLESSVAKNSVAAIGDGFVAISIRLDLQRWSGPYETTGTDVDLYRIGEETELVTSGAHIISAPATAELDARSESVITLAIPTDATERVIAAAAAGEIWLVGA